MNVTNMLDERFIKNCHSCTTVEKDADRILFNMEGFCKGVLRRDNHGAKGWIGRTVIFTEKHITDSREVSDDLNASMKRWRNILKTVHERLFNMTRDNFAEAGNMNKDENNNPTAKREYHHHHFHFIPRYAQSIELFGIKYMDLTFKNIFTLDPVDKDNPPNVEKGINVPLTPEQIPLLKEKIQTELVKMIFDKSLEKELKPTWKEISDALPSKKVIECYEELEKIRSHEDQRKEIPNRSMKRWLLPAATISAIAAIYALKFVGLLSSSNTPEIKFLELNIDDDFEGSFSSSIH